MCIAGVGIKPVPTSKAAQKDLPDLLVLWALRNKVPFL